MLDSTKYPNNVRTVSGTPQLYKDDVVLLCDTSGGAVVLNLLEIPDQWNTLWKLYIIDVSGNAMTNNITINAGGSQIVNGNASLVIDVDNGSAIVRISQTGKFNAGLSYTTVAPGTGHVISDDGTPLTQQPILNFVGAGVTATNGAGETIITIPGGGGAPVELTNAQLLALIGAGTIVKGTFYCVTDPLGIAESVVVQGCTPTTVTNYGSALFFNADYQLVGDYSAVPTIGVVSNIGTWNDALPNPSPSETACIWNNQHYINTGGGWGSSALDGDQWSVLARSLTTGFIAECNFVLYDVNLNGVIARRDSRWNWVEYADVKGASSMGVFPWGNDKVTYNTVASGSIANISNSNCTITGNVLTSGAELSEESPSTSPVFVPGEVTNNTINGNSAIHIVLNQGIVKNNTASDTSNIDIENINGVDCVVQFNNVTSNAVLSATDMNDTAQLSYNTLSSDARMFFTTMTTRAHVLNNTLSNSGIFTSLLCNAELIDCIVNGITVDIPAFNLGVLKKRVEPGFSNFAISLDFSDIAIYPGGNLVVLDPLWAYVGVFTVTNSAFLGVAKIQNSPTTHPFKVTCQVGNGINLSISAVGVAVADDLIGDEQTNAGTKQLTGRTNGSDQITIEMLGNLNAIIEKNVWA